MKIYFVKQGDSISSIAHKYGVEESALMRLNGLNPGEELVPGSKLKIPVLSVSIDQRAESKPKEKEQKPEKIQKPAEKETKKEKKEKLTAEKPIQQPVQVPVPVQKPPEKQPQPKLEAVQEKAATQQSKKQEEKHDSKAKDLFLQFPSPALEAGSFYDWPNMAADAAIPAANEQSLNIQYEAGVHQAPQVPWGMPYPQMNALLQYQTAPANMLHSMLGAENVANVPHTTLGVQHVANAPKPMANAQFAAANAPNLMPNVQMPAGNVPYPSLQLGTAPSKPCGCGAAPKTAANAPVGMSGSPMPAYYGGNLSPLSAPPSYGGNHMYAPASTLTNMMDGAGTMPVMSNMMPNVAPNMMPNVAPNMMPNMMPYSTANMMPNMAANAKAVSSMEPKAKLHETSSVDEVSQSQENKSQSKARTKSKKRQNQTAVAKIKQLSRQSKPKTKRKKSAQIPWVQYPIGE